MIEFSLLILEVHNSDGIMDMLGSGCDCNSNGGKEKNKLLCVWRVNDYDSNLCFLLFIFFLLSFNKYALIIGLL